MSHPGPPPLQYRKFSSEIAPIKPSTGGEKMDWESLRSDELADLERRTGSGTVKVDKNGERTYKSMPLPVEPITGTQRAQERILLCRVIDRYSSLTNDGTGGLTKLRKDLAQWVTSFQFSQEELRNCGRTCFPTENRAHIDEQITRIFDQVSRNASAEQTAIAWHQFTFNP